MTTTLVMGRPKKAAGNTDRPKRHQRGIQMTDDSYQKLEEVRTRLKATQISLLSALVEWYVEQPIETQASIYLGADLVRPAKYVNSARDPR